MESAAFQKKGVRFASSLPFLFLISFLSLLNTVVRTIFSPLVPSICQDLHLCHAHAGNLFFTLSVGFSLTLFSSQFLSARLSHKKVVLLSLATTGGALLLTAYASNFHMLRAALFLLGLCSGFFIPSAVALIREVVHDNHLGKAFGIFGSAQSIAFIFGSFIVQGFSPLATWQTVLQGLGVASLIIAALAAFMLKQGAQRGDPITFALTRSLFLSRAFWIILALLCLANGLNIVIYNMASDYFQSLHLRKEESIHHLIDIARAFSIVTAILAGAIADRLGLKRSIFTALILCGAATMLMGFVSPSTSLFLFCLQSPIAACLMPLVHFAMATIVPPEKNAALISLMAPFAFFTGAGIVPQLLGFFGDFHLYAEGFVVFGIMALAGGLFFNSSRVYRHVEVSQADSVES